MRRIKNNESRTNAGWGWRILAPLGIALAALWPRAFAAIFLRKP